MRRTFVFFVLFVLLLTACNLPQPGVDATPQPAGDLMATVVAATFQAMTPQASPVAQTVTLAAPAATETPTPTPTASAVKVSGKVCYHDKNMLALTVYFQNTADDKLWQQSVSRPNETYSIDLPAGKYKVYAWPPDYTVGVLVKDKPTVDVTSGQPITGLDLCDYSKGPFAVPYPPGVSPSSAQGSISGNIIGYSGSGDEITFTVVAFNQGTGYWYYVILLIGQKDFVLSNLPAGRYQVVAYDGTGVTGGTEPTVYVVAGQNTSADISSWGAGYPANPVK
jgi:hypothetical protein